MNKEDKIYVAGHNGMVGSALVRKLKTLGFQNVITCSKKYLNLIDQATVKSFFKEVRPKYVIVAAAKVGGIHANSTYPADFLYQNIMIAANVINAAATFEVEKLLYLGSSCIYPRLAPQPISEDALLSGPLEPTNEGYALAKIAGLKLCEMYNRQYGKRFISAMPTNLYGPGDNYHPDNCHVIPGMMRRFHEAKVSGSKEVTVWGTGTPKREFLHVEDLADALLVLMDKYEESKTINVGSGEEVTIAELADLMGRAVGYSGQTAFKSEKYDGPPRKALNSERMRALGWAPKRRLEEGLAAAYKSAPLL